MRDWLIEPGIGETRTVRLSGDAIAEARIQIDGMDRAGDILQATLLTAGRPAVAVSGDEHFLLPKGAAGTTEGGSIFIEVTRERIPGGEPWKRPLARMADGASQPQRAEIAGEVLPFPDSRDRLREGGWADLLEEARSGVIGFDGGELRIYVTPAMTLIDVDGQLAPSDLAVRAAVAAAAAIVRHSIGGSIGIDFPTLSGKRDRRAVDETIDGALPQPFERTAVNGFGFLQIVRPRRYASTFELAQDRPAFEARALLRRAALAGPGPKELICPEPVATVIKRKPEWVDTLGRQVGGPITLRAVPSLPIHGGDVVQA